MNISRYVRQGKVDFNNLLTLEGISATEIAEVISVATELKRRRVVHEKLEVLRGKYVLILIKSKNIRSQINFKLAVKELGGEPLTAALSGENLEEIFSDADYLKTLADSDISAAIVCTSKDEDSSLMKTISPIPVINANENKSPVEAFADIMTIAEKHHDLKDVAVTIIGNFSSGDLSLVTGLSKLGANVCLLHDGNGAPDKETLGYLNQFSHVEETTDKLYALKNADVIYFTGDETAVNASENDLVKNEKDYIIMSAFPAAKNEEIRRLIKNSRSFVKAQTENLLHAAKAVLALATKSAYNI